MKVRLIKNNKIEFDAKGFNVHAMCEIDVYEDSIPCSELEIFIDSKQEWKNLHQAFKDGDIVRDNYNQYFREPKTEEERKRGWYE